MKTCIALLASMLCVATPTLADDDSPSINIDLHSRVSYLNNRIGNEINHANSGYKGEYFLLSVSGQITAYQGVELLPLLANQIDFVFEWLFGFHDPHLVAFPITALGAVGASLSLVPGFIQHGWIDGNAIAVFTAIGMCWSGFLSTHTAMLDSLGYRDLTPKAISAHFCGGLVAAICAHWMYFLYAMVA